MRHAAELLAILILMSAGQSAVDPFPRSGRRGLYSFIWITGAFAAAIAIVSIPYLAATATQIGIIVLAIYFLRWIAGSIADHFRGPFLCDIPVAAEVAETASDALGIPLEEARQVTGRILKRNEGYTALAALYSLEPKDAANLEEAWQRACDETREAAIALARSLNGTAAEARVSVSAVRFITQAFCLYERESVKRALARAKECRLTSRGGRENAARLLEKQARRLETVPDADRAGQSGGEMFAPSASLFSAPVLLWPAAGLFRLGYNRRALLVSVVQALLILYGLGVALSAGSIKGNSGYVFLSVALLIHIQALLAMRDFAAISPLAPQETAPSE